MVLWFLSRYQLRDFEKNIKNQPKNAIILFDASIFDCFKWCELSSKHHHQIYQAHFPSCSIMFKVSVISSKLYPLSQPVFPTKSTLVFWGENFPRPPFPFPSQKIHREIRRFNQTTLFLCSLEHTGRKRWSVAGYHHQQLSFWSLCRCRSAYKCFGVSLIYRLQKLEALIGALFQGSHVNNIETLDSGHASKRFLVCQIYIQVTQLSNKNCEAFICTYQLNTSSNRLLRQALEFLRLSPCQSEPKKIESSTVLRRPTSGPVCKVSWSFEIKTCWVQLFILNMS